MKIGIYSPHLRAYGGGEKYICKIAEILSKEHDVEFIIFGNDIEESLKESELEKKLNVDLSNVHFKKVNIPNIFKRSVLNFLFKNYSIKHLSNNYNIFISQTNFNYIPLLSQKNFYMCQIPPKPTKSLKHSIFEKIPKTTFYDAHLETYNEIIVYSEFVKKNISNGLNKDIKILYPPVESFKELNKENFILSVGRFFVTEHNKKQLEMIKIFKQLHDENVIFKNWEFHLVGGVTDNKNDLNYLKTCEEEAKDYPIYIHPNAPFSTVKEFYGKSKIFWHATGLGINQEKNPELMEHFGITTGEAMSAGCVPVVINKGGQPEIVKHKVNGFLWNSEEELKEYTIELIKNAELWKKMNKNAICRSKNFGMKKFENRVKAIIK